MTKTTDNNAKALYHAKKAERASKAANKERNATERARLEALADHHNELAYVYAKRNQQALGID